MAGLNRMTEQQMKEAYKEVVSLAFTKSRRQIAEKLGIGYASVNGMFKRLADAGFDLPKRKKVSVLQDEEFVAELKGIFSKSSQSAEE